MTDKLEPLRILKNRLRDVAKSMGLELQQMPVIVGDDDGDPTLVTAMLVVTEQAMMTNDQIEQKKFDEQFASIAGSLSTVDPEKMIPISKDIAEWLKDEN